MELNIVSAFHLTKLKFSRKIALEETAISKYSSWIATASIKVVSSYFEKTLFFNQNDLHVCNFTDDVTVHACHKDVDTLMNSKTTAW